MTDVNICLFLLGGNFSEADNSGDDLLPEIYWLMPSKRCSHTFCSFCQCCTSITCCVKHTNAHKIKYSPPLSLSIDLINISFMENPKPEHFPQIFDRIRGKKQTLKQDHLFKFVPEFQVINRKSFFIDFYSDNSHFPL